MNAHRNEPSRVTLIRNWMGIAGAALAIGSLFVVLCLIVFDFLKGFSLPYMGLLTYLIIPQFIWIGLMLMGLGLWQESRRRKRTGGPSPLPHLDLNNPRHRRNLSLAVAAGFVFMLATAFGSFRAYQVTESVSFCGALCHTVMKPEYTTYQNSPHAKVRCTACHIGPGASWFVRSKISGLYQVYAVLTNSYPRPIPVPVQNLRPARETCEECHWPEKFYGAAERTHTHFLSAKENPRWTVRLLVKVGGANPTHGPVGGIHWHMIVANRIEYIPADETRQTIPWVRLTNRKEGRVTVYESKDNPLAANQKNRAVRVLDCIDCHNRPTHIFQSPDQSLDLALWLNRIDPSIPSIKMNAARALAEKSSALTTQDQMLQKIAEKLGRQYADYKDRPKIEQAILATQGIYRDNFFPKMKTNWQARPDNIGHQLFPGCFRCHDGRHVNNKGESISHSCDACHTIIAQGKEPEQTAVSLKGLKFDHPGGEIPEGILCNECHTGVP
jgi:NapC/NirT cytochrome c family, N-terminal region